ncbi:MAG: Wzz/FepE/Etk N-terminal domain-containing protein [Proteobacteria bacterium]|nr:Wzz/FepE/Etk N-terminal domain-containing protein [Pseudomonadota bacterium]
MESTEDTPGEINLIDYMKIVWKHKRLIIGIIIVIVFITAIIALLETKIYEANAVIAPAGAKIDTGSLSMAAAQFGLTTPASANVTDILNVLNSNILKERIINKYNLLSLLFKSDAFNGKTEDQKSWAGIRALNDILKVNFSSKDNTITISVQHKDPKVASNIVKYTLEELTELISSEAKRVADTNKKYLESQIDKTLDPFIRTKIYSMIAQQIETSMMAEVKENFAFKVIDPPRIPDRAIKPKKLQMVKVSFIASFFLGIFIAFLKEYIDKFRMKQSGSSEGVR